MKFSIKGLKVVSPNNGFQGSLEEISTEYTPEEYIEVTKNTINMVKELVGPIMEIIAQESATPQTRTVN